MIVNSALLNLLQACNSFLSLQKLGLSGRFGFLFFGFLGLNRNRLEKICGRGDSSFAFNYSECVVIEVVVDSEPLLLVSTFVIVTVIALAASHGKVLHLVICSLQLLL
jgi:hypothetical protein